MAGPGLKLTTLGFAVRPRTVYSESNVLTKSRIMKMISYVLNTEYHVIDN